MKHRTVWLLVSGVLAAALVLTSCQAAAPEAEGETIKGEVKEEKATPKVTTPKEAPKKEEPKKEAPKKVIGPRYGGTIRYRSGSGISTLDIADKWDGANENITSIVYEGLFFGDWDRGPNGTGEFSYTHCCMIADEAAVPRVATELIIEDPQTFVFKIRKGIKYHNKFPTWGRELTAEDVAFAYNKMREIRWPRHNYMENVYARDKYTFVVETNRGLAFYPYEIMYGPYLHLFPEEVYNAGMGDWKNHAGSGPFMIGDYVQDSHITYVRNPDYWYSWTAPDGKSYQLPFVDKIVHPLIPDLSTTVAAITTAQLDLGSWIPARFKKQIEQAAPDVILKGGFPGASNMLHMRQDLPDEPTYDQRVRLALAMAIDRQAIADTVFGGEELTYLLHPTDPINFPSVHTPIEETTENIRMAFTYDPERAKELLTEAGYPNGFTVTVNWGQSEDWDAVMEMVMFYWKEIGVTVIPNPMEGTTAFGKFTDRDYVIALQGQMTQPNMRDNYRDNNWNGSMFRDPEYEALWEKARETLDRTEREPMIKQLAVMLNDNVGFIAFAQPNLLSFWWPWIKNYGGETNIAYQDRNFMAWVYLDEDARTAAIGPVD